jgi:hypothetical protein
MKQHVLYVVAAASLALATTSQATYTTSTVTACFNKDAGLPTLNPQAQQPSQGLLVTIPGCGACDCSTCSYTTTYATAYPAFDSSGTKDVTYAVTEVRTGMKEPPSVTARPDVPEGFTAAVETCTVCGDEPLTRTMTYPAGGAPFPPAETSLGQSLDEATGQGVGDKGPADVGSQDQQPSNIPVAAATAKAVRDAFLAAFALFFTL